jgi:hypothetical protein
MSPTEFYLAEMDDDAFGHDFGGDGYGSGNSCGL